MKPESWTLFLAVQVDDYLHVGEPARMQVFETFLQNTFEDSKLDRNDLSLLGCTITQSEDYSIELCQD